MNNGGIGGTGIRLSTEQLAKVMQCPTSRASRWTGFINDAMVKFEINTPLRVAHFLAQVGHESGRLFYVKELASGTAYEGRKDLGNTEAGDGVKYKGRGLIQITGRANYKLCGYALDIDLLDVPEWLELPKNAALSAAWYWSAHSLNQLADTDDFVKITKRINGGTNGLEDRKLLLTSAKIVLGIT